MKQHVTLHSHSNGRASVEIDRQFQYAILEALRYAYGRHTASTPDTAIWVSNHETLERFDPNVLEIIWRDINEFEERRERLGVCGLEIYECDVAPFLRLRDLIEKILLEKGFEVDARLGRMFRVSDYSDTHLDTNHNSNKGVN